MSDATETTPTEPVVADPPKPARRPFRKRHPWLMRLAVALVTLLVLTAAALIAVQLVLTSSYPRTIAEGIAGSQLGLDVKIGKLDIPWFGKIVVRDISVSLPLADKPFVTVPTAYAEHDFLPVLAAKFLISGDPGISLVGVRDPRVEVRQDADGQWNVVRALDAVLAAQHKGPSTGGGGLPPLPAVKLVGGVVHVVANTGTETTLDGLEVNAAPDGALRYDVGAGVPGRAIVHANVVPRGAFVHTATFDVQQIKPYLAPFLPSFPEPVMLKGKWEGRLAGGGVAGRLTLESLRVDKESARGTVDVTAGADGATLTVRDFAVDAGQLVPRAVTVTAGTLTVTPEQATASGVRADVLGGVVAVPSAKFVYAALAGEAAVDYQNLAPLPGYSLNGHADARAFRDQFDQFNVAALLNGVSTVPAGTLTTRLTLAGDGRDPGHMDLTAVVQQALFEETPTTAGDRKPPSARVPDRVTTRPVAPSTFPAATPAGTPAAVSAAAMPSTRPASQPAFAPAGQFAAATAAAESYNLPQITAKLRTRFDDTQSLIALDSLRSDDPAQLLGRGEYDFGGREPPKKADGTADLPGGRGYLWVKARGIPFSVPRVKGVRVAVDAGLNAWVAPFKTREGDVGPLLRVEQFYASAGGLVASGNAAYAAADPVPVHLLASIVRAPDKGGDDSLSKLIRGDLKAVATIDGLVTPIKLAVGLDVLANNLTLLDKYNIDKFALRITGDADGKQVHLQSETFDLFGGEITLEGTYPYRPTDAFVLNANIKKNLNLRTIGDLLRVDRLDGTAGGNLTLRGTDLALDKIRVDGTFDAADIRIPLLKLADAAHVELRLRDGGLKVSPLTVTSGSGTIRATAAAADVTDLADVKLTAAIEQFPLELNDYPVSVVLDGNADDLHADFTGNPEVNGSADVTARVNVANVMDLADAKLKLTAAGRAAVLDTLSVTSKIGGEISGNGKFDLDRPDQVTLNVSWEGLDGKRLADLTKAAFPITDGLTGTHSGHLTVAPATGRNPLGPVRMELFDDPTGGAWREIDLGQTRLIFFYEPMSDDPATPDVNEASFFKPQKIVTGTPRIEVGPDGRVKRGADGQPEFADESIIRVAGGEVRPFVRLASQPGRLAPRSVDERGPDILSGQVSATFRQLQVGAAARSVRPDDAKLAKVRARVGGEINLRANLDDPSKLASLEALAKLSGSGRLDLSDADLKGVGVLNKLVGAAAKKEEDRKAKTGKDEGYGADPNATGHGTVRFQLEADALRVTSLDLLVEGIQIQGAPVVSNLSALPKSELSGVVIAAARPLGNIKLPFFADADQILGALQQSAASFRLKGTLENLGPGSLEQTSIADAGGTLKEILTGEAAKK